MLRNNSFLFSVGFVFVLFFNSDLLAKTPNGYCFGAVGKQCAVPGSMKGKPSPLNMVACSKVEKGQTNCWVSPGSIEHDNCCLKHPNGVMCTSETKHDGNCAKEWEDAYKDISKKMAWYHVYNVKKSVNLASVPSKRLKKFGGQEVQATAALCAPGGTKLLAFYDSGFCCAEKAKKQGEVMICAQEAVAKKTAAISKKSQEFTKKSQDFLKKSQDTFAKLNTILKGAGVPEKKMPQAPQMGPPSKQTQKLSQQSPEQKWSELSPRQMTEVKNLEEQMQKFEQEAKEFEQQAVAAQPSLRIASVPPPPPLPPMPQRADPHPLDLIFKRPPPPPSETTEQKSPKLEQREEPVAANPEPQPQQEVAREEPKPDCSGGAWSPTLGACVENQTEEAAPPPDCGAGAHWSPTLQSCQAD